MFKLIQKLLDFFRKVFRKDRDFDDLSDYNDGLKPWFTIGQSHTADRPAKIKEDLNGNNHI